MSVSLKARFDTSVSLKAEVDQFTEQTLTYSLDFSLARNSFYIGLF